VFVGCFGKKHVNYDLKYKVSFHIDILF